MTHKASDGCEASAVDTLVSTLYSQTQEIAKEGHNGWGNTMTWAADEIEQLRADLIKYRTAMDAIYNHNEAARLAVIQHFGTLHTRTEAY